MIVLRKIGVLKGAAFLGLYSFFVGIIISLVLFLISTLFASLLQSPTLSYGSLYLLLLPIIYGVVSFVAALIVIPIMNLTLKITKGITLDLEEESHSMPA